MGRQNPLTLTYSWFSATVLPMVKLKSPLLSLGARNTLSKAITFVKRRGQNIAEKKPEVPDAQSPAQLSWRTMFNLCVDLWHTLSATEKQEWESLARPRHMTGYAWYISQCLRPNPGIYLPLLGGTMQGIIDMASHKITGLPAPVAVNDAVRKAYADLFTLLATFNDHHARHENGGADEPSVAGLSGLLSDDQHVLDAEAVSAMGVKADDNPLHHDRYTDAEVDAIADALDDIHAALITGVHGVGDSIIDSILARNNAITAHAGLPAAHHTPFVVELPFLAGATVPDFRVNPATGTMTNPQNINNNNTGAVAIGDAIGEYAEVDFGKIVVIDQCRIHGHGNNNQDGEWKIEYYGLDAAWHNWVTDIPTNLAAWTPLSAGRRVACTKVKLTVVTVDSGVEDSMCGELEVFHT